MTRRLPHIGLRTFKTGLATALALLFADLRHSPLPIFAAIGAIVAMNRTVGDAFESCRTQFFGIVLGAGFGALFVSLFVEFRYIGIGLGLIALIWLCVKLRLQFAVPLASIVFVSVCLSTADSAFLYGVNRLIDTSIGLATALVINIVLKPYNNRARITGLFTHFMQSIPAYVEKRVIYGQYPDLSPLTQQLHYISEELSVFEKQHMLHAHGHRAQSTYLRGCEQLAQTVLQELTSLCAMDEKGRLSPQNAEKLSLLGLSVPDSLPILSATEADVVGNYHLRNLLQAYHYLSEFILME